MSTDDPTTGLIELSDMSKLRVLMGLRSRGQLDYAKDIANEIKGADAKELAHYLLRRTHARTSGSTVGHIYAAMPTSQNGHATLTNGSRPSPKIIALAKKFEKNWAENNRKSVEVT